MSFPSFAVGNKTECHRNRRAELYKMDINDVPLFISVSFVFVLTGITGLIEKFGLISMGHDKIRAIFPSFLKHRV